MAYIEATLKERGSRYGDFSDHAVVAQALQNVMRLPHGGTEYTMREPGWERLSDVQKQALTVITDKIARILTGDPNYADNWHDIQGYAKLAEERLPQPSKDPRPGSMHATDCECIVTPGASCGCWLKR